MKYIQKKTHTKLTRESYFFKTALPSFISDTFINNKGGDLIQSNNNLKYQKELKEKQAFDHQHLKVKDIGHDISLIKNYCITISMPKIISIHKFNLKIQEILGSHELKCHAYAKIIEPTFIFLNL